jgi:hypothetical protein
MPATPWIEVFVADLFFIQTLRVDDEIYRRELEMTGGRVGIGGMLILGTLMEIFGTETVMWMPGTERGWPICGRLIGKLVGMLI